MMHKEKAASGQQAAHRNNLQGSYYQKPAHKQANFTVVKHDYKRLGQVAAAQLPTLLEMLGISFRVEAGEIKMLNPHRADGGFGSFSINRKSGRWADFAVNDARGGDAVSLVAYLQGIRQGQAAQWIRKALGVNHG